MKYLIPAWALSLITVALFPFSYSATTNSTEYCPILCQGEILKEVQLSKLLEHSTSFVHMKLLADPLEIEKAFAKLKNTSSPIEPNRLKEFVSEYFSSDTGLTEVDLPDWKESPDFIKNIYDKNYREWLKDLNGFWKELAVRTKTDVKDNPNSYSLISLPYAFVVPGGFFTEMYYWDSYWVIEGLLLCEMDTSASNMLENFFHLIKLYGHIPNGSRKYYLGRSQPPLLTSMVDMYYQYTKDFELIESNIELLHQEYEFWLANRSIKVSYQQKNYTLFRYSSANDSAPRPESYLADYTLANGLPESEKNRLYNNIRAAAESGWDFSSRWFIFQGNETDKMEFIKTDSVVPVDLNSFMCRNAALLSSFYQRIGNVEKASLYQSRAVELNYTISRFFWDEDLGFWFDFNLDTNEQMRNFYASGFVPLWAGTYGTERSAQHVISKVLAYLHSMNITSYPGGIPTSLISSGQQWDFPNGWAPLQYFAVLGLKSASLYNSAAGALAEALARKWVKSNYVGYVNSKPHRMMEKYNVSVIGAPGSGGEYQVQTGFGWTNGVVMKFMELYPHSIRTNYDTSYVHIYVGSLLLLIIATSLTMYSYRIRCSDGRVRDRDRLPLVSSNED